MPVCHVAGRWRYRAWVTLPDGRKERISGTPAVSTRRAALDAERAHIMRLMNPSLAAPRKRSVMETSRKEVPTLEKFAKTYLDLCLGRDKHATWESKESILRCHLVPAYGTRRLNAITCADLQDFTAKAVAAGANKKTVNNRLSILRRVLVVAKKRGLIEAVPEFEWLKVPESEFDFLSFDESPRLLAAADAEWRTMILVGLRTGLRQGELLALRWDDVDLVRCLLSVRRAVSRGVVSSPKNGKGREVPLSSDAVAALKGHRHLRGELVFCPGDGRMFRKNECKHPLWRSCKKAGLRRIGWHVLRHTEPARSRSRCDLRHHLTLVQHQFTAPALNEGPSGENPSWLIKNPRRWLGLS
jgi:integrase